MNRADINKKLEALKQVNEVVAAIEDEDFEKAMKIRDEIEKYPESQEDQADKEIISQAIKEFGEMRMESKILKKFVDGEIPVGKMKLLLLSKADISKIYEPGELLKPKLNAVKDMVKAMDLDHDRASLLITASKNLSALHRAEAKAILEAIVEKKPYPEQALVELGNMYLAEEDYANAKFIYESMRAGGSDAGAEFANIDTILMNEQVIAYDMINLYNVLNGKLDPAKAIPKANSLLKRLAKATKNHKYDSTAMRLLGKFLHAVYLEACDAACEAVSACSPDVLEEELVIRLEPQDTFKYWNYPFVLKELVVLNFKYLMRQRRANKMISLAKKTAGLHKKLAGYIAWQAEDKSGGYWSWQTTKLGNAADGALFSIGKTAVFGREHLKKELLHYARRVGCEGAEQLLEERLA